MQKLAFNKLNKSAVLDNAKRLPIINEEHGQRITNFLFAFAEIFTLDILAVILD